MNFIKTKYRGKAGNHTASSALLEKISLKARLITDMQRSKSPIKNPYYQKQTQGMQNEFDQVMEELVDIRTGATAVVQTNDMVEDVLDGFYLAGSQKKHISPTKRLINQKNSTVVHKQKILNTMSRGRYSQIYNVSPGKSYVIEP